MDTQERFNLIKQVGEEIITEKDLKELLETKAHPIAYDGFEPSGQIHIAQGILRAINVNKMIKAGVKFKMLSANWHAWANRKFGGDLDKIRIAGKYLIEVWKQCGMKLDKVEFVWDDDIKGDPDYWKEIMKSATSTTIKRVLRCSQIMGRKESETQYSSQIIYPLMQLNDIFRLKCDITQLGMDQRKVNMLAREMGPQLGYWKPVVVSHHMLMGLGKPSSQAKDAVEKAIDLKMSKSKPDTAIFMTDSKEDVKRKINKAYCPEKIVEENPIMDYCKHIIFEKFPILEIKRPTKFGGDLNIEGYEQLTKVYSKGDLHPMDLKQSVAENINQLIEPVRKHFEKNSKAKKLLEQVKSFKVVR